jgi:hypothetical protein
MECVAVLRSSQIASQEKLLLLAAAEKVIWVEGALSLLL